MNFARSEPPHLIRFAIYDMMRCLNCWFRQFCQFGNDAETAKSPALPRDIAHEAVDQPCGGGAGD
jgi:hypothetical protein